jgi:hypothetical protein
MKFLPFGGWGGGGGGEKRRGEKMVSDNSKLTSNFIRGGGTCMEFSGIEFFDQIYKSRNKCNIYANA